MGNTVENAVSKATRRAAKATDFGFSCEFLYLPENQSRVKELIDGGAEICDQMEAQLLDLMKCLNPSIQDKDKLQALIAAHLSGRPLDQYGVWVYYPWSHRLVHLLEEAEFAVVRTNRNKHKITAQEQQQLASSKIGIIGLSVGQSVALALSLERGFGELRLADFDTLDLSNLNRLRAGVHELGLNKAVIAARQIAELDPFLNVTCFTEGITEENMEAFFLTGGKLDLLIEECDNLGIKVKSRLKARSLKIPVLMDTSDRGMLDIERFDLEPERPILHGLLGDFPVDQIEHLPFEQRLPLTLQLTSWQNGSIRAKASIAEIGQTIATWPQLGSSVMMGSGVTADIARKVLTGAPLKSGRYYVDPDNIISSEVTAEPAFRENPYKPLDEAAMLHLLEGCPQQPEDRAVCLQQEHLEYMVAAGIAAPSTGNDQPWKWLYQNRTLFLFHDRYRSHSFGDYRYIASWLTLGAVWENVILAAQSKDFEVKSFPFPSGADIPLVCAFRFYEKGEPGTEERVNVRLAAAIKDRCTNRNPTKPELLPPAVLEKIKEATEAQDGANLQWLTKSEDLVAIGKIIGACDRMRFLHPEGHQDFVHHEMRWTQQQAEETLDGIDIQTLGLPLVGRTLLQLVKERPVASFLSEINGGSVLQMAAVATAASSAAIGFITVPGKEPLAYLKGGRASERCWLQATQLDLALHPLISPLYFFPRIGQPDSKLSATQQQELTALRERFTRLFKIEENSAEVFLFKIGKAAPVTIKSLRHPVREMLIIK